MGRDDIKNQHIQYTILLVLVLVLLLLLLSSKGVSGICRKLKRGYIFKCTVPSKYAAERAFFPNS